MVYLGIFLAKLIEVSISTVRTVLAVRGMRTIATILAGFEITIWLLVASSVLTQIHTDPLKGVAYVLAYMAGIFLGLVLEDKMALGLSGIEVIADCDTAAQIAQNLRAKGYGVTEIDCKGRDGLKQLLDIKVHRKDLNTTLELLRNYKDTFISIKDIRSISRGNISRHIFK